MSRALPQARTATRMRTLKPEKSAQFSHPSRMVMTPELIQRFLDHLRELGRTEETVYTYRGHLERIHAKLGRDSLIQQGTLERIGQEMLDEGYSPNTVNVCFAAVNSFLEYYNRRDLQVAKLDKVEEVQPELTRNEYLRILMAARQLQKEREYLLVKVLATTGVNVADLTKVTVEAVKYGAIVVDARAGKKARRPLANGLRDELLAYINQKGMLSGPVFLSRNGRPMERSNVNARITALAHDARVDPEKCNPRCLQRLYKTTVDGIAENLEALMQQMYMQILDKEQLEVGWEEE